MNARTCSLFARLCEGAGPRWLRLGALATLVALVLGGTGDPETEYSPLERLASWPGYGRGPAVDIAVANDHAFVAIEEGGLLVLDISDPGRLVRVSSYALRGQAKCVRVSDSRAFVATRVPRGGGCRAEQWRGRLVILDVRDPAAPVLLGSYSTEQDIQCLFVEGNRVYLGDSAVGLQILDVTDPARPTALSCGEPRDIQGVQALWGSGSRLYCAMFNNSAAVDVSSPDSPTILGEMTSAAGLPTRGICARDNLVFVTEGNFGFGSESDRGVLSVFGPDASGKLVLWGKLQMPFVPLHVALVETTAYLAAGPAGIVAVDVSNPAKPILLGELDTPGMAVSLAVAGTNAFVADYHGGLQVVGISAPAQLSAISTFDPGLTTRGVRVFGGRAYLVSSDTHPGLLTGYEARSRLEILDVKDPNRLALLGTYEVPACVMSSDVAEDLVCLGFNYLDRRSERTEQRMHVVDPATPTNLICLSGIPVGDYAGYLGVRIHQQYVFIGSSQESYGGGLSIRSLGDAASPLLVGQTNSESAAEEVWVEGGLTYVGPDSGLAVYDVTDFRVPRLLSSIRFEYPSNDECFT